MFQKDLVQKVGNFSGKFLEILGNFPEIFPEIFLEIFNQKEN
jgi:hypothetical protein